MSRYVQVRELIRNPALKIKDIAAMTGYNKGHISRLRKQIVIADQIREAAQRKPLTDEEILNKYCVTPNAHQLISAFKAGVRFAEAAHGIKGQA